MDFYGVLDQVIDLLQSRKRIAYLALKRQFDFDDDDIEALKAQLIEAQRIAVDEAGKVLVWTGPTQRVVEPTVAARETGSLSIDQEQQLSQAQMSPPATVTPNAERRHLTVMFCDLVDSTPLSGQLDPEDLRDCIRSYQAVCTEVICRFDGHVAQLLGDGLLVYFGYPQAHEDDAQRAVHAGLGMLEAMVELNQRLEREQGVTLAIRVGIHTGLVVVGEMGGEGRQEQLALGETPNVADRIQGLAEPDTVVISGATYQLARGYFEWQALGEHILRGVAEPLLLYRVLRESGAQSRLDVATPRGLTPLVGRESEVALLLNQWEQAQTGRGQVVLLIGEAGIGKSRQVQVLKEQLAATSHMRLECRSSPYYQNTALYPIIDLIHRLLQWEAADTAEEKLHKLEDALGRYRPALEASVPLFAALLSLPLPEDRYPPLRLTPQVQRQQLLDTLAANIMEESERQPVLFIVEDLHWSDPTTLEFLDRLMEQSSSVALFGLLTCRPEFEPPWLRRSHLTEVSLTRLSQHHIEQMAERVANGKRLPDEVMRELIKKTDGVPLYLEEMTKAVIESGVLKEHDEHYELTAPLSSLAIPVTLHDSLMARLDRLASAKGVAQLGAVIGRQFSYELIHAISQYDEDTLQRELGRLIEAELVYERGRPPQTTYIFKHALIQDAAFESLLRSTRQGYHRRIAEVLVDQFPEIAEAQPELLAHHYTESGDYEQAVDYWQQAGQRAGERSAHAEAIAHLTKGLAVLATLPQTSARLHLELELQVALGPALMVTKGHGAADVEHAYARARELCQQIGDTPQLFPVLRGLIVYYLTRGQLQTAHQLGEQLLDLGRSQSEATLLMLAHHNLGMVLFFQAELASAQSHHAQALALYTPQEHRALAVRYGLDYGVGSHTWLAWELWHLGYPDQALQHSQAALTLAQQTSHPFSRAAALLWAAFIHQWRREVPEVYEQAVAATTLATEQGFALWAAWGTVLHGWARSMQGEGKQGIEQMHQGLNAALATGEKLMQPYFLCLLAEAHEKGGHCESGLPLLSKSLAMTDTSETKFYAAEISRLKGVLLLKQPVPNASRAEAYFHQALGIACTQQAKSLELRATTSLARLWQSQGKRQDAYDLLAPVYEWFTEGFDTPDLQDAKVLLDELAR